MGCGFLGLGVNEVRVFLDLRGLIKFRFKDYRRKRGGFRV